MSSARHSEVDGIRYEHVSFSYPGSRANAGKGESTLALEDISLAVRPGERLGILGPNGGGKSTLLKLTMGLLTGYSGQIRVFGHEPAQARQRRLIGYVAQRSEAELAFPVSARQVVEMGAAVGVSPWRRLPAEARERVTSALELVGADSFEARHFGSLSGGQRQRALIARALASGPKVLVLDEPMVGVDVSGQRQFAELIERLNRQLGLTIMIVSHDIRTIAGSCDRVACLSRTLHFHDAPAGLTPRVLAEVFRHDVAAVFGDVHVDAHPASGCTDPAHHHGIGGGGASPMVDLGISAGKRGRGDASSGGDA